MVKTFTGKRGGRRNKLPIRRTPNYVEPDVPKLTENERTVIEVERSNFVEGEVTNSLVEEINNMVEKEITNQSGKVIRNEKETRNMLEEEAIRNSDNTRNLVEEEEIRNDKEESTMETDDDASVEEDDCEVIVEDRVGYNEPEPTLQSLENEVFEVEVGEADLSTYFGAAAHEDGDAQYDFNDDSGNDIWDDDLIPDPLSDDVHDEEEEGMQFNYGPGDILALGKTFNNAEEFKFAVLKYSLKTQYDIKFYKSSSDRLGAQCTRHEEGKCPWRVYCSFERGRNKLMVKVFIDSHICVRSGYTKLLKSGTIGQFFEERLRINPKIRSQEMVDEIKREYNMIVSLEQCRRAKAVLSARRKAGHEAHFA